MPRAPSLFFIASYMRDVSVAVDEFPRPGETRIGNGSLESSGGKGSNQAIQAARAGARVGLIAAIAQDAAGAGAQALWSAEGIDTTALQLRSTGSTGLAVIVVNAQGENQIVIAPGVNSSLSPNEIEAAAQHIRAADLVVAQLETPIAATVAAFTLARAAGVPTLLNTAPAPASLPDALWSVTDILIANELEAATLAGMPVDADPSDMAAKLLLRVRLAVVITLGAAGALLMLKPGLAQAPTAPMTITVAAPRVEVLDSTGAGDSFVGAFAATWAGAESNAQTNARTATAALVRGVAAGSLACQQRGVVPALARREAIEALASRLEQCA